MRLTKDLASRHLNNKNPGDDIEKNIDDIVDYINDFERYNCRTDINTRVTRRLKIWGWIEQKTKGSFYTLTKKGFEEK